VCKINIPPNSSLNLLVGSDSATADESSQLNERSAFCIKTDSEETLACKIKVDKMVNVLRNALDAFKIVVSASIDTGPTDFALPEPSFGDLMREKIDSVGSSISCQSQVSSRVSGVISNESDRSLVSSGRNMDRIAIKACRGSSSDSCLYQKTGKQRGRPRKLHQNGIRQNSTRKSVTDFVSNSVLRKMEDPALESGDMWTLSAVHCTRLEVQKYDFSHVLFNLLFSAYYCQFKSTSLAVHYSKALVIAEL